MNFLPEIIEAVVTVYVTIDAKVHSERGRCQACGNCCSFKDYDHRLFVTSPEILYFKTAIGKSPILPMQKGVCPYKIDGKCTVYEHRFAGCRIFSCKDSPEMQSDLSERSIKKFKEICEKFDISYNYTELSAALNELAEK